MTAQAEGRGLRYLRWGLKRYPRRLLITKLQATAHKYAADDPLHELLVGTTESQLAEWENGTEAPSTVITIIMKILGFPRQFLGAPGFLAFCEKRGLGQLDVLHLGRRAIQMGQFRGEADEDSWEGIVAAVLGTGFQPGKQLSLLDEFLCSNCGFYDPDGGLLLCPECGDVG